MGGIADVATEFVESSTGLLELASDVSSVVTEGGLEFLNEFGGDTFFESGTGLLTLGSDLGVLDASYELVGSFAGDAGFFNLTDFGSIIDTATTFVSDFSIPSAVTNQITGTAIKTATNLVSSQIAQIPVVGSFAAPITRSLAGAVNANIAQTPGFNPITGPSLSQLTGITPNIGIPNVPGIQLASLGNNIPLNLLKTQNSTVSVSGVNGQPLSIQTPGFNPTATQAVNPDTGDYYTPVNNTAPSVTAIDRSAGPVGYTVSADPEGGFAVVSNETGLPVATGLTEQQALLQAQEQTFIDAGEVPQPGPDTIGPLARPPGGFTPAQLNAIAAAQGVDLGEIDFTQGPQQTEAALFAAEAATTAALRDQARQQQTIRAQRQNQAQSTDWRVRLRLAPTSNYLYNATDCGPVLWPLRDSDGVIFPYTPAIDIGYKANYQPYDLTHSNYRGYFYKNSAIDAINLRGTFTAQDTTEANYLLAVIHFFRSVTKMFYGQDAERGSPPPLTYLSGFGDYQFREHPCLVSQFNYNLPADVNYIRAQSVLSNGTNLLNARKRQTVLGNPLSYALQRLSTVGMTKGGLDQPFAPSGSLGADNSTYVPTKMEIQLTLLPVQSRSQVSKQFSVKGFANGNLLKGGFW
jgi:hypothetical protein